MTAYRAFFLLSQVTYATVKDSFHVSLTLGRSTYNRHYRSLTKTKNYNWRNKLRQFFLVSAVTYAFIDFCGNALADYPQIDLKALSLVESSGRANAIGDGGKALGLLQIHSALVSDFNRLNRTNLKHKDVLNPVIARDVANWALHVYFPLILKSKGISSPSEAQILTCYNMGCGAVLKGKVASSYVQKYNSFRGRDAVSPASITASRLKTCVTPQN